LLPRAHRVAAAPTYTSAVEAKPTVVGRGGVRPPIATGPPRAGTCPQWSPTWSASYSPPLASWWGPDARVAPLWPHRGAIRLRAKRSKTKHSRVLPRVGELAATIARRSTHGATW